MKLNKLLSNWIFNACIITVIPFIIGIVDNIGSWKNDTGQFNNILENGKIFVLLLSALYVTYVIYISYKEHKRNKMEHTIEDLQNSLKVSDSIIASLNTMFNVSQEEINKIAKGIKTTGNINLINWNFESVANHICRDLADIISNVAIKGSDITVNVYLKTKEKNNSRTNEYITMIAHSGGINSEPKTFGQRRLLSSCRGYEFAKSFLNRNPVITIYENEENIRKHFKFNGDYSNYEGEYTQYIGIPIACSAGEVISLLEIISHHNAIISETKEDLLQVVNNYIIPYKNFSLLSHKIEKVLKVKHSINERMEENG